MRSIRLKLQGIKETRLKVGHCERGEGIGVFGMPYDRSKTTRILKYVGALYEISSDMKRVGPSSLDICDVASGRSKFYCELDLKEWDISAGALILAEAGGRCYKKGDFYLFYNPESETEIKEVLKGLDN